MYTDTEDFLARTLEQQSTLPKFVPLENGKLMKEVFSNL